MKIHFRIDDSNSRHTHLTLFIDGANCGQLGLLSKDAISFLMIVRHGASPTMDEYVETGKFTEEAYT